MIGVRFRNVAIESVTYVLPEDIWTSENIEDRLEPLYRRLDLCPGRLEMMTGIRERRHWEAHTRPSEVAVLAGKKLLERTALSKKQIDVLVNASVCRDRLEPATAAYVHAGLELGPHVQFFDISNACLGVLNAVVAVSGLIESQLVRAALIVAGENGRTLLDGTVEHLNCDTALTRRTLKPFFGNLTIGSGAIALLVCHRSLVSGPKPLLVGGHCLSDTEARHLCEGQLEMSGQLGMQTDSEALLNVGLRLARRAWSECRQILGWDDPHLVVTHQVSKRHRRLLYETLALDPSKDFSTVEFLGNTGSAALPLTLAKALEERPLAIGEYALLLGIGSGVSTVMLGLQTMNL
jgi:3-oxoacyl-[acyl-carrier-protein] synthase-3